MSNKRALLLHIMNTYKTYDYELGYYEMQRLAYLLQNAGCDLRLKYNWTEYGPYSDNFNKAIDDISGKYLIVSENSDKTVEFKIKEDAIAEMQSIIKRLSVEEKNIIYEVERIIEGFENPYSLRLIANALWIKASFNLSTYDDKFIINYFNKNNIKYFNKDHIKIVCRHMNKIFDNVNAA